MIDSFSTAASTTRVSSAPIARHLLSGEKAEGGSTITMQLTRGIFLSPEKSYRRKLQEIFRTLRIEQQFSKQEILALY